ncbi:MAG: TrmH family RNA methyltransferase [Acidimicrobiales bacterium]
MTPKGASRATNRQVVNLRQLRSRSTREAQGRFLIEGFREISAALAAAVPIEEVYFAPELHLGGNEPALLSRAAAAGAALWQVPAGAFEKLSRRDRPEGLMAVSRRLEAGLGRQPPDGAVFLVAEATERPGNLGTMIRTACAFGASGVIVADQRVDPFSRETITASIGTIFSLPLSIATSAETIAWCRSASLRIVAASPSGTVHPADADLTGRMALVMGSEASGVPATWLAAASTVVSVPMAGNADSLNLAVAAGVVLYEALARPSRSRGSAEGGEPLG